MNKHTAFLNANGPRAFLVQAVMRTEAYCYNGYFGASLTFKVLTHRNRTRTIRINIPCVDPDFGTDKQRASAYDRLETISGWLSIDRETLTDSMLSCVAIDQDSESPAAELLSPEIAVSLGQRLVGKVLITETTQYEPLPVDAATVTVVPLAAYARGIRQYAAPTTKYVLVRDWSNCEEWDRWKAEPVMREVPVAQPSIDSRGIPVFRPADLLY